MHVGIDARFYGIAGIGRYQSNLIRELKKIDSGNEYFVFLTKEGFGKYAPAAKNFHKVLADQRPYSFKEQLFFPWLLYRYKLDLVHFTHFSFPLLYFKPFIVTIHDLIMSEFPTQRASTLGWLAFKIKRIGYLVVIHEVIRRAKRVLAVSQATKEDVIKSFGVDPNKVTVTYEGLDEKVVGGSEGIEGNEVLEKYGIKKPFLLYVSSMYPHKNVEGLVKAFKILRGKRDLQLVLVGKVSYFSERAKEDVNKILREDGGGAIRSRNYKDNVASDVIFPNFMVSDGYLPDDDLRVFYQEAKAFVFPSFKEGFGLPALEAMAHRLPVVASDIACLREICGGAAEFFDPRDIEDMAKKVEKVLDDEGLRQQLIEKGLEQIKKFSWMKMAKETLDVYRQSC